MKLNKSKVIFIEDTHQYFLEGKPLSGITQMISEKIFGDKYKDAPEEVLERAAAHGSFVHKELYNFYDCDISPISEEAKNFISYSSIDCKDTYPEYIVSDNKNYATAIDLVVCHDLINEIDFYDYKTTSVLDTEYLSWQLSICKYLFLITNPEFKGKINLFGAHLRGEMCNIVRIKEKSKEAIENLLNSNNCGLEVMQEDAQLRKLFDIETEIIRIKTEAEEAEKKKKLLLEGLTKIMDGKGLKSLKTDRITITKVLPTTSNTFDSKAFKADNEELYNKYLRPSEKKGFTKVTIHDI